MKPQKINFIRIVDGYPEVWDMQYGARIIGDMRVRSGMFSIHVNGQCIYTENFNDTAKGAFDDPDELMKYKHLAAKLVAEQYDGKKRIK